VDAPFEYAERLASLVQRQQQIEDELDFTKNQVSSRLEADTAEGPQQTPRKLRSRSRREPTGASPCRPWLSSREAVEASLAYSPTILHYPPTPR